MRRTGVSLLPGSSFGTSSSSLTFRLAFVDFDGKAALSASESRGLDVRTVNYVFRAMAILSVVLLSCFVSSGVVGRSDLLLAYLTISLALHNTIILIITNPKP